MNSEAAKKVKWYWQENRSGSKILLNAKLGIKLNITIFWENIAKKFRVSHENQAARAESEPHLANEERQFARVRGVEGIPSPLRRRHHLLFASAAPEHDLDTDHLSVLCLFTYPGQSVPFTFHVKKYKRLSNKRIDKQTSNSFWRSTAATYSSRLDFSATGAGSGALNSAASDHLHPRTGCDSM